MLKWLFLFLGPHLLVILCFAWLKPIPLELFNTKNLETSTFTDKENDGGKSVISKAGNSADSWSLEFELRPGFISPYAGISFFSKDSYWDLSAYDEVEIEVELENTKNLELSIATYQDGVTKENEPLSFRHSIIEVPVQETYTTCKLGFNTMQTAQWWLEKFKLRSTEIGITNWKKAKAISLVAKIRLDNSKVQLLKIHKIKFTKNLTWFYWLAGAFIVCWYAGVAIAFRLNKRDSSKRVIEYKQTDILADHKSENNEIENFIAKHYTDPDLTLTQISETLKISEKAVSGFIKKNFDMTFKEYLNGIRMAEAKRLLQYSDKNVSEIAYQVGFNSPNHFNRTFKNATGSTPTEFKRLI